MSNEDNAWAGVCDAELLRRMSVEPRGSPDGQEAWAEFYGRHRLYMYRVCYKAYVATIGEARVAELVQDTFVRAYERSGTFVPDITADADGGRRRVRAWLGRISQNMLRDYFRREPHVIFLEESELQEEDRSPYSPDDVAPSDGAKRIEKALAQLTLREQEVLRVTGMWYQPGRPQQRLPNSVAKELASSLNTSSDNIRQIRARAMNKLRALMDSD